MSDPLLSLPVIDTPNDCQNCGVTDWGSARIDLDHKVIMCNKCPDVPSDWDPLVEMQ